ncbi:MULTISPECIES: methylisocitrate lyase [unclassified Wenzhouxiangella]|uniref:methylisocitrate lyase n=1 Tax=unclassified Wenzhouxiangella TaxID=2613841 RepID=UPI000E32ADAD|nr:MULTISPECIES: methylisocitrate lyase [unclassified Wenzhouxiangella]RFF28713.1 methylisocitrate lyase [Wenzhouxiangella sp. 15181]RFP70230.1 methylisocitrate lyase [Wenzhouxiangella sp. 15190]
MSDYTPGARFRKLVAEQPPLQVVGTINAYSALLAENAGHRAIYLSGGGVANASYGLPDLGITQLADVLEDARRITAVSDLPLLVDVDTGWGSAFNIARTIREMERAGVAAVHLEDQVAAKRCGHRPNKALVSPEEMADRVRAAVDARQDDSFVFMARTDAYAGEGMAAAVDRASLYAESGADMIFAEALHTLEEFAEFARQVDVPVLANITEFGKTPLFSVDELREAGAGLVLYPLSAFRAMSKAALAVYEAIGRDGHQKNVVDSMQTRDELYEVLGYHEYEQKLDQLFSKESS